MKTINDIGDVQGKTIFVRVDLNVPVQNGIVTDDFRIQAAMPTITLLLNSGAHLVLASHFESEGGSLKPVYEYLKKTFNDLVFVERYFPVAPDDIRSHRIVLLENLRQYEGEKMNDPVFGEHLAHMADIYVNESFASSHRAHASFIQIPKYISSYAGLTFMKEVENLSKAFNPEHPFLFILGGAKFETKIPLVKKFSTIADTMFIGGAIANDFFQAKGIRTGQSRLSKGDYNLQEFLGPRLILPDSVIVECDESFSTKTVTQVEENEKIVDVGLASIEALAPVIESAKTIVWNGPLGNYETGYIEGTEALAKLIAQSNAHSIVGGGDTVASIAELNLSDSFTFLSSAGGAMLDFLADGTLPGIEALNSSYNEQTAQTH